MAGEREQQPSFYLLASTVPAYGFGDSGEDLFDVDKFRAEAECVFSFFAPDFGDIFPIIPLVESKLLILLRTINEPPDALPPRPPLSSFIRSMRERCIMAMNEAPPFEPTPTFESSTDPRLKRPTGDFFADRLRPGVFGDRCGLGVGLSAEWGERRASAR